MKSSEAAQLVFTIAGLIGVLYGVLLLVGLLSIVQFQPETTIQVILGVISYLVPAVVLFATGYYLIRQSKMIANQYFSSHEESSASLGIRDLEILAFSFLGLFVFLNTLPKLANLVFGISWLRWNQPQPDTRIPQQLATSVGALIQAVAGAYLFFYSPQFARFWRRYVRNPVPEAKAVSGTCPYCGSSFDPNDYTVDSIERRCSKCKELLPDEAFERNP